MVVVSSLSLLLSNCMICKNSQRLPSNIREHLTSDGSVLDTKCVFVINSILHNYREADYIDVAHLPTKSVVEMPAVLLNVLQDKHTTLS